MGFTYIVDSLKVSIVILLVLIEEKWIEVSQLLSIGELSWKNALHNLRIYKVLRIGFHKIRNDDLGFTNSN